MQSTSGRSAAVLGFAWTAVCALLAHKLIAAHFPLGDEWALLAAADGSITSWREWFTLGFSEYFVCRPELMSPYTDFARPGFNAVYALLGLLFEPDSGARLLFNCAVVGALSALTAWAALRAGSSRPTALLLAAMLPLLPSLLPALVLIYPFLAYDPLTACLCVGALIAYQGRRYALAIALMTTAVLTKETSLALALALPVHYWLDRRGSEPGARARLTGVLLALPFLGWIALRWLTFGDLSGGTYTVGRTPAEILNNLLGNLRRWPLWVSVPASAEGPMRALRLLLIVGNFGLIAVGTLLMLRRLLRLRNLDPAEWTLIFAFGMILLTGTHARFGAVLSAFLLLSLAQWLRSADGSRPWLYTARLAVLPIALSALAHSYSTWHVMQQTPALLAQYQDIGRDYIETLRSIPAGRRVLVLNDPVSWHSRMPSLTAVSGVRADVEKIGDFSCPSLIERLLRPCSATLTQIGERRYEFAQSCGLSICGSRKLAPQTAFEMRIGEARVSLPPAHAAASANPWWDSYTFELDRGDLDLLYFDPATREFRILAVP